jgi:carboxypeptidase C (cathepsin A)
MTFLLLLALLASCFFPADATTISTTNLSPEAQADLVTSIPGLPARLFGKRRMFSGYIPVDGTDRELFYWLVESDHGLANRPILLWTNGGPGCSGLLGFLTEQGPFRPTRGGRLVPNDFAWTRYASVVFIEQPVGVGFSRSANKLERYSDLNAAQDNYRFIVNFFERFSELKHNEFYITSESYGGHYLPTLARQLVDRGGVQNFKGMMVGNPLTSAALRAYGEFATFAGHQLLPQILASQYFHANKCRDNVDSIACLHLASEARSLVADLDPYGLDFPTCHAHSHVRDEKLALLNVLGIEVAKPQQQQRPPQSGSAKESRRRDLQYFPDRYQPCEESYTTTWLNRADVQKALHVRDKSPPWAACNNFINAAYNRSDVMASMVPYYQYLSQIKPPLKIWIYSGDDDSVCATAGDQEWIWDFPASSRWQAWHVEDQVAGYVTHFRGFVYSTVHGAGHMVPTTRPKFALELLKRFLEA